MGTGTPPPDGEPWIRTPCSSVSARGTLRGLGSSFPDPPDSPSRPRAVLDDAPGATASCRTPPTYAMIQEKPRRKKKLVQPGFQLRLIAKFVGLSALALMLQFALLGPSLVIRGSHEMVFLER